jgi:hypothetical protein
MLNKFSYIPTHKEKEIIVWIRLQEGNDKYEILDFISKKFDLDQEHAETLYYKAFPEGLQPEEFSKVDSINNLLLETSLEFTDANELLDECFETAVVTCDDPATLLSDVESLLAEITKLT